MRALALRPLALGTLITALAFAPSCRPAATPINGQQLATALASYALDLRRRGEPIPLTVSLDGLVRLGYLKPEDIRAFEGVRVVFHSDVDDTHPQKILVEAFMQDGTVNVVLGDGSVQQLTPSRYKDQIRAGQQDGAANGSQPIRSETNRTSSAAGSRR